MLSFDHFLDLAERPLGTWPGALVVAVIAVEHDISFVRALDADTLVLHQGRKFRRGPFREIEADDEVRDIYLGRR